MEQCLLYLQTAFMAMREHIFHKFGLKQTTVSVFASVLFLLVGVFGVSLTTNRHAAANNQKYVTIHYDGTSQTVATDAKSVGELLDRVNISVGEHDAVEPAKNTALISNDYNVNVYRARPVTVVDNGQRYRATTAAQGAREMATAAGVKVYTEDNLEVSRVDDFVGEGTYGLKVIVDRAVPITFDLYGTPMSIRTQATTVGELLKEKKITLQDGDTLNVAQDTTITAGMTVKLVRNGVQTVTLEEDVPFETEKIKDADQPVGYREVKTQGKNGRQMVTYEVTVENGQEVSRKKINAVVKEEPVKQVEVVGAKPNFSGDFAEALAKLRSCEGGYSSWNPAGPYYGAYQFNEGTWNAYAPEGSEFGNATPEEQDQAARNLYEARGWQPWPSCGADLPDIYR